MLRRKLIIAFASLATIAAGAYATAALVRPAAVHAEEEFEFEPLPTELGDVPRTGTSVDRDGVETTVYDRGSLHAEIAIAPHLARRTREGFGGIDATTMTFALPRFHAAVMRQFDQRASLRIESQNRSYEIGDGGINWRYVGNVYSFRGANGAAMRRLLLVTTHDHRLVVVTVDVAADRNAELRPFLDMLSGFFFGTLPVR